MIGSKECKQATACGAATYNKALPKCHGMQADPFSRRLATSTSCSGAVDPNGQR